MSHPNSNFSDFDYTPSRERRGPAPITNFPGNALSGDSDPTRDLRTLIEQLQQSARDSRNQLVAAVAERDELATQVDRFRHQNEELRAHFVEITSLIRERDSAVAEAEQLKKTITETQARLATVQREISEAQRQREDLARARDEAHRQRDELVRQRDDARRQIDTLTSAVQESNQRYNDVQRQLINIRQARDAAMAQNNELKQKIATTEDQLHEFQDQLDTAQKSLEEARTQAADPAQLTELQQERDAARQQVEETATELQQLRDRITELTEQNAAAQETSDTHANALGAAQEQIAQLTGERDNARAEIAAKDQLIEEIRNQRDEVSAAELDQARSEIASFHAAREANEARIQTLTQEANELRQQLQARTEQIATVQRTLDETSTQMSQIQAQFDRLQQERNSAVNVRDEATTALSVAQKQIERIIRERDLVRQQGEETTVAMEAQIEALLAQLAAYEAGDPTGGLGTAEIRNLASRLSMSEDDRRELADRLERQRNETINLGAQLHAAQDQIRELSATLAEARLQALNSGSRGASKRTAAASSNTMTVSPWSAPVEIFDVAPVVEAMRRSYQAFIKDPSQLGLLGDLAGHGQTYAELARGSGLAAVERVAVAFSGLAQELFQYPEQITPAVLRTVQQGIEFLTTLPKLGNLAQAKDPATATVYTIDDDPENCECIRLAMDTATVSTVSVHDPAKALCDLASTPCDLIFLDVNMPGMDGFELCAELRNLSLHMNTPVIFVTGVTTPENRAQSQMSGGNEFVGKPFLLCEVSLKALTLMMKAQLHLA
ncbi:response regulator [Verrucomicrobiota bacterium sgz303538]